MKLDDVIKGVIINRGLRIGWVLGSLVLGEWKELEKKFEKK